MRAGIIRAANLLAAAERVVVLTGAGVSKESGIPTFRDAQEGLWAQYDPLQLATEDGFLRNPSLVWAWYEYRFGMVAGAQPNSGHIAIAALEKYVPTVRVVTQNIDGLHQAAGSSSVLELHGSIRRYRCLSGLHSGFTRDEIANQTESPPRCPRCGEMLRPDVVWFGEYLSESVLREAFDSSESCDVMLVVGTSGVVQPAATLPFIAQRAGATVIDVNPQRDEIAHMADIFLEGAGGVILPALLAAIGEDRRCHGGAA